MSETIPNQPTPVNPNDYVQHLINTWERRPRRQIDFSMLTKESIEDCEWIAAILQAMIPASRVIAEKFDMTPNGVIMLQMAPPVSVTAPAGHPDDKNGHGHGANAPGSKEEGSIRREAIRAGLEKDQATHGGQPAAPDADDQSKGPETTTAAEPSNDSPKTRRKKGRSAAAKRRRAGKSDKLSAALAKSGAKLSDPEPPPAPPEPPSKKPGPDLTDPPAPKLSAIG